MTTALLTGLPRSGTTLLCAILNKLPNTVALAEPMPTQQHSDPEIIIEGVRAFAAAVRAQAISEGTVPTQAIVGRITDNFMEAPKAAGILRKALSSVQNIPVGKPLTSDFYLYIKHPALFTALSSHLWGRFSLFALIRAPLAVLASWQTVDLPVHYGYLPVAERLDAELRSRLKATPDRVDRQVEIIAWFLNAFAKLPARRVLRYEDLIQNPDAMLASLQGPASGCVEYKIFRERAEDRYAGVDTKNLARRLAPILPLIEPFYPHYQATLEDAQIGKPMVIRNVGLDGRGKSRVDFFLAGVQKGGTTALADKLKWHPSVRIANKKETHFFDDSNKDWKNPDYEEYHCWFQPTTPGTVVWGEATPIYFYQQEAMDRIRHYNPQSKFIISLRHPTFRAHSQWRMEVTWGNESWDFSRAITPEGRDRIRSSDRNSRIFSYVERGLYAQQFRNLFKLFPREHVHIVRTDRVWEDSMASLAGVWPFLGVEPIAVHGPAVYRVPVDSRGLGPISPTDRRYLDTLFRREIEETQLLTGLDLSDWLEPDYEEPMPQPRPTCTGRSAGTGIPGLLTSEHA